MSPNPQFLAPNCELDSLVRRVDEDRWLASRFAPPLVRERLIAIYAVNYEIARTAESVSELALGAIRLEWWRQGLEAIAQGAPPRQHPALTELSRTIKDPIHAKALQTLVEARRKDFEPSPFATWADLDAYVDATAGVLLDVGIEQCAPPRAAPEAFIKQAGRAWGYTGLLRAAPHRATRGLSVLPKGASKTDMLSRARDFHETARPMARELPHEMFPAIGYLALTRGYLRALKRGAFSYPLLMRQAALVVASATGKI